VRTIRRTVIFMAKTARLYVRLLMEQKREFEQAAKESNMTLTAWILAACLRTIKGNGDA
jgi:uncharacterized protein (DUF1778 family)